ncbi:MAG: Ig-like domain-containing protein [Gemmatimonadota bacterium]|nr:Ig-like domain-containing protein [Gemmatimonadota bacterium]
MKTPHLHPALLATGLILLGTSCSGKASSPSDPVDATPPTVTLTASEAALTADGTVMLVATASDSDRVASVEFREGATSLGTASSAPYQLPIALTAADNGLQSYTAVARDASGNQATSAPATVDVAILHLPLADDFDDNATDSTQWTFVETGGGTAAELNARMEVTIPAALTASTPWGSAKTRCTVTGDFDVQVDYEVLDWPAQSGVRAALHVSVGAAERVSFAAGEFTGQESYAADHSGAGGTIVTVGTSDQSGMLRATRIGSTLTSYYWSGTDWAVLQSSGAGSATEVNVHLAAWTHESLFIGQQVRIAFDDFRVVSGQQGSCS